MGTFVVGVLVFGSAALICWRMLKQHKQGGGGCSGCGGACGGCSGSCLPPQKPNRH